MPLKHRFILFVLISIAPFLWILKEGISIGSGASFAGFVGVTLFFWQLVLGNRFLVSKVTEDVLSVNAAHKFLGMYGTIFVLVHPVLMMLSYAQNLSFITNLSFKTPFETNVSLGRSALALFIIIWISSAIVRKRLIYRPWLYLHYLAYPMMGMVLLHAREIGTNLTTLPLLGAYWQVLIIAFVTLIVFRLSKWAGIGKVPYILGQKTKISPGVIQYTFSATHRQLMPKVGQYCYIQSGRWKEAHPFTVMKSIAEKGSISFGIKEEGLYTKSLTKLQLGDTVYIDGPYGVFTKEGHNQNPKVLIAAGIGITPFVDLVQKFGTKDTYLFYSNKTLKDAVSRDELKERLKSNYFDALTQEETKEPHIISGRLNASVIKKHLPNTMWSQAQYFLCGPEPFYQSISADLKKLGVVPANIHYEAFGL